jgi:hypothetical protein
VAGLAVMVRRELVGPVDRSVPDVFAGTLDQGDAIAAQRRVSIGYHSQSVSSIGPVRSAPSVFLAAYTSEALL